ncbi:MAG: hypothetical protein IKK29_00015 [Christensenellaceae bacterium]|nr:hypothetical protein [Christensenellaceae bacterium]
MKKIIAVLLMIAMVLTFAACGAKEEAPAVEEAPAAEEAPAEKAPEEAPAEEETPAEEAPVEEVNDDPYFFASNGVEIRIMDEAEAVLSALGDPMQTFEADSCAFQGKDYFYYYDGFQLMVNDVDGVKRITSITMVDDTVKAPQGIGIGSKEEDIAPAFGEDYTSASSMYVYRHDTTSLQISVLNGKVSAMVYAYAVAN